MVLERILLQTIKFDLQVEHPYMFLLRYVKQLKGEKGYICSDSSQCVTLYDSRYLENILILFVLLKVRRIKCARCYKWHGPLSMTGEQFACELSLNYR